MNSLGSDHPLHFFFPALCLGVLLALGPLHIIRKYDYFFLYSNFYGITEIRYGTSVTYYQNLELLENIKMGKQIKDNEFELVFIQIFCHIKPYF